MIQIPDDPIIASMLRTGYPPWMLGDRWEDDEDDWLDYDSEDEEDEDEEDEDEED